MNTLALLGAGTVGSALVTLLQRRQDVAATIAGVLVRDLHKPRADALQTVPLVQGRTQAEALIDQADIVVEMIGGTEDARHLLLAALAQGKTVVTANKAVLAEHWDAFAPYLQQGKVFCEAAVMAGTPAIEPLTGVLRGAVPLELHAILNGTCNYILGQLETGIPYPDALAEAQRLGYAEADPSLDVEGIDAAHKLSLLARFAFDPALSWQQVKTHTRGITTLTPTVLEHAMQDGGRIRLVGSVYPQAGAWHTLVRPVFLPAANPLAGSASSRNGMYVKAEGLGQVIITGAGAGAAPTASGVLSDIIKALAGRKGPIPLTHAQPVPSSNYQPEVLGEVSS